MNVGIAFFTLISLVISLIYQMKIWKFRVLVYPGFYFCIVWILGVSGLLLFKSVGLSIEPYPEHIDELNIFILYTSLCFMIVSPLGRNKININGIIINYFNHFSLYVKVSIFYFIISLYIFFIEGRGFDFASARDNMHETLENRNVLVGYFRLLSIPLSIYAGSILIRNLIQKKGTFLSTFYLILPFLSNTLFSLSEGGRVAMVYGFLLYIVGMSLSVPINFKVKNRKKIFLYLIFSVVFLNTMITWVSQVRNEASDRLNDKLLVKNKLGFFDFMYGGFEYVNASYLGYQFRKEDAIGDYLGYGQYTFNGFINWQIPFLNRFGINDFSIADFLELKYHNQETYDGVRPYYYVTHSNYIPIYKDFGFYGSFAAILFLVLITQYFFLKIQKRNSINKALIFFFYYLFLIYWARSNFYGTLSESILIPIYGLLIIDILNKYKLSNK